MGPGSSAVRIEVLGVLVLSVDVVAVPLTTSLDPVCSTGSDVSLMIPLKVVDTSVKIAVNPGVVAVVVAMVSTPEMDEDGLGRVTTLVNAELLMVDNSVPGAGELEMMLVPPTDPVDVDRSWPGV